MSDNYKRLAQEALALLAKIFEHSADMGDHWQVSGDWDEVGEKALELDDRFQALGGSSEFRTERATNE